MRCTRQFKEESEEWHECGQCPGWQAGHSGYGIAAWVRLADRAELLGTHVCCNLTHNLSQSPCLTEDGGPGEETGGPDPGKAYPWGRGVQAGREGQKRLSPRLRVGMQTGILGKDREL